MMKYTEIQDLFFEACVSKYPIKDMKKVKQIMKDSHFKRSQVDTLVRLAEHRETTFNFGDTFILS